MAGFVLPQGSRLVSTEKMGRGMERSRDTLFGGSTI